MSRKPSRRRLPAGALRVARELLTGAGFQIRGSRRADALAGAAPCLICDEGWLSALRFVFNVLRRPQARKRVLSMRRMFRKHYRHLTAVSFVAVRPDPFRRG